MFNVPLDTAESSRPIDRQSVALSLTVKLTTAINAHSTLWTKTRKTRMWANAQRDGRPAEYRWRRLFNAAKFG